MTYNKPSLSFDEQISLLSSRGLNISNPSAAKQFLSSVSYYRLSGYMLTFQADRINHIYRTGATFEKIVRLYEFDKQLRMIVFDAIESIEIAIRTQLIYHLSQTHGSHWFTQRALFRLDESVFENIEQTIEESCLRGGKNKEVFIKHYVTKYTSPQFPPAWMSIEILSLGQLSKLFKALDTPQELKKIAQYFGIDITVLSSWLHSINYLRNICAHHSRLWNKLVAIAPKNPHRTSFTWISNTHLLNPKKIYFNLCVIQYLLKTISPNHWFSKQLIALVNQYPEIPVFNMDFPHNWKSEVFWQ